MITVAIQDETATGYIVCIREREMPPLPGNTSGWNECDYEYYRPGESIIQGTVRHHPPNGAIALLKEICEDIDEAYDLYGGKVTSLFFPAGNSIAMPTRDLAAICRYSRMKFPDLQRITVYGSSPYIVIKGPADLVTLRKAGLSRIHVGLESGDDDT